MQDNQSLNVPTIQELYEKNIFALSFNIFGDAIGAKVYKKNLFAGDVQLKLNMANYASTKDSLGGRTRLVNMTNEQLKDLIENLQMLLKVSEQAKSVRLSAQAKLSQPQEKTAEPDKKESAKTAESVPDPVSEGILHEDDEAEEIPSFL